MIENESSNSVIRISQIYSSIMSHPKVLTNDKIHDIKEILLSLNVPPKRYKHIDYYSMIDDEFDSVFSHIVYNAKLCCLHRKYEELLYKNGVIDENQYDHFKIWDVKDESVQKQLTY